MIHSLSPREKLVWDRMTRGCTLERMRSEVGLSRTRIRAIIARVILKILKEPRER